MSKKIVTTAIFIALGVMLPIGFHYFSLSGSIFLPMHLPVLLCGIATGPIYGAIGGVLTVFLSSLLTEMPVIYPSGISMSIEMAIYASLLPLLRKRLGIYPALFITILVGRTLSTTVKIGLLIPNGDLRALPALLSISFAKSMPGLILIFILVPILTRILGKGGFIAESIHERKNPIADAET